MKPIDWWNISKKDWSVHRELADLQDHDIDFRWHATNLRTGGRWEFSPTRVGEALLGYRWPDRTTVAEVVASSVIEPSTLSPMIFRSDPAMFEGGSGDESAVALRGVALLTIVRCMIRSELIRRWDSAECSLSAMADRWSCPRQIIRIRPAIHCSGRFTFNSIEEWNSIAVGSWRPFRKGQIEGTYIGLAVRITPTMDCPTRWAIPCESPSRSGICPADWDALKRSGFADL